MQENHLQYAWFDLICKLSSGVFVLYEYHLLPQYSVILVLLNTQHTTPVFSSVFTGPTDYLIFTWPTLTYVSIVKQITS